MNYQIPLFDLNFDEAEEKAVLDTLKSKWISMGPKCTEFEEKFAQALNIEHAVSLNNCTAALHLALRVLDIGVNDEVIVPSVTFVATVNVVNYVGATPVFADIQSMQEPTISPDAIRSALTSRTKAIIVMHYGGFSCRMQEIMEIAKQNGLFVIEDACHGPLSEYHGQKLGTIGDIGCFSFFSNKNISTGEGGMIVAHNPEYASKARLLRSHGMTSNSFERASGHSTAYNVVDLGYNYRLDDIRAAIGIVQLDKLPNEIEKRRKLRKLYLSLLQDIDVLEIPFMDYTQISSNYIFPVVLKNSDWRYRDEIRDRLAKKGIQTSIHYPAVHRFSNYTEFKAKLPNTEYFADNEITLPMYGKLSEEMIEYIVAEFKSALI